MAPPIKIDDDTPLSTIFPEHGSKAEQDKFLTAIANDVARKMGLDPKTDPVTAVFSTEEPFIGDVHTLGPDHFEHGFKIGPKIIKNMTLGELKWIIGHEIWHPYQSKLNASYGVWRESEYDADLQSAKKLGPQNAINALEKMGGMFPFNFLLDPDSDHPSIRERQIAIIKAFPDQYLEIVHPVLSPEHDTLSQARAYSAPTQKSGALADLAPMSKAAGLSSEASSTLEQCRTVLTNIGDSVASATTSCSASTGQTRKGTTQVR